MVDTFATAPSFATLLAAAVDTVEADPLFGFVSHLAGEPEEERYRWLVTHREWDLDGSASLAQQLGGLCYWIAEQGIISQVASEVDLRGWIYAAGAWHVPSDSSAGEQAAPRELWMHPRRQVLRFAAGVDEQYNLWQYVPGVHDIPESISQDRSVIAGALRALRQGQ